MDIYELSTSLAQSNALTSIGMSVLDMQLDDSQSAAASQVASLADMPTASEMELSVNPSVGGNFDMSI